MKGTTIGMIIIAVIATAAIGFIALSIGPGTPSQSTQSSVIQVDAKEVNDVYRWSSGGKINPTLNANVGQEIVIKVQNPTDAKHEFVIESDDKEVATSGDIDQGKSGQFTFKPDKAGTFEYKCEYHPTTMNGTIEVKGQ